MMTRKTMVQQMMIVMICHIAKLSERAVRERIEMVLRVGASFSYLFAAFFLCEALHCGRLAAEMRLGGEL